MADIKRIVANADANARVEGMELSKDTVDMKAVIYSYMVMLS